MGNGTEGSLTQANKAAYFDREAKVAKFFQEGTRDRDLILDVLQAVISDHHIEITPKLHVPELFISPADQLALVRQWNEERGWGFTPEQFAELGEPPQWSTDSPLVAVVLEVCLGSLTRTLQEFWYLTGERQKPYDYGEWHDKKVFFDEDREEDLLRLVEGITFQPNTLRWRIVELGANHSGGSCTNDVREDTPVHLLPHVAILCATAYFPEWVQAMDGTTVPYVDIAGIEVNYPGRSPWARVPYVRRYRRSRETSLGAHSAGFCYSWWGVPVFRPARRSS